MSISQIPFPVIIFKYDAQAQKYFPANHVVFDADTLGLVPNDESDSPGSDDTDPKSKILGALLDYIYSGKQDEAWSFFDREYNFADKVEIQKRIKAILKDQ